MARMKSSIISLIVNNVVLSSRRLPTTKGLSMHFNINKGRMGWPRYYCKVFHTHDRNEERPTTYVFQMKNNIKYPPSKMWFVRCFVRRISINENEAVRQLTYVNKKGAGFVQKTLLEAQKIPVQQHNDEFRSNLWVAESFCRKGVVIKGICRKAKESVV